MKKTYFKIDPWKIVEEDFDPNKVKASESIFSLGNGVMGQRANFEEEYSGDSFQGSYMAEYIILIKPKLAGGKMVIPSISLKYSMHLVGLVSILP